MILTNEIQILGARLSIYEKEGNEYFLASEVGEVVGYSKSNISKMVSKIDDDEKTRELVEVKKSVLKNGNSSNGSKQYRWFLNKDGLYELLFLGKNEKSVEFKKRS